MTERKYSIEIPDWSRTSRLIDKGFEGTAVCKYSDVEAMRDKMQDEIDRLKLDLTLAVNASNGWQAELIAEQERSNELAREVGILRVDVSKAREEALKEAAQEIWTLGPDICRSDAEQAILSLVDQKGTK